MTKLNPPKFSLIDLIRPWLLEESRNARVIAAGGYPQYGSLNEPRLSIKRRGWYNPSIDDDHITPRCFLESAKDLDSRSALYLFLTKKASQIEIDEFKYSILEILTQAQSVILAIDIADQRIAKEKADQEQSA